MRTPDFIRVEGTLYRARRKAVDVPPEYLKYAGATYRLAALPKVQSHAVTLVHTIQRLLHEADIDDGLLAQLAALEESLRARKHNVSAGIWRAIQPRILKVVDDIKGEKRRLFGEAALSLDEFLSDLAKAAR